MATNCFQLPANKQAANRKIPKAEDGAFCKPGASTLVVFLSPDPSPGGSVRALPCTRIHLCTHGSLHAHPWKWICLCACGSNHVHGSVHAHPCKWIHPCTQGSVHACPRAQIHSHTSVPAACLAPATEKPATGARISRCRNTLEPLTILLSLTPPFLPCLHTLAPQIPPMLLLPAPTSPAARHSEGTLVLSRLQPYAWQTHLGCGGLQTAGFWGGTGHVL